MSVPPPTSGGGGPVKPQPSQEVPDNGATLSAMEAAQEWSGKPRSLVPVSDDDNTDEEDDDDDEEDDSSLDDSEEDDDSEEEDEDDDDDDQEDKVINLGENITDSSLEGLLNVAPITVMKVDSTNAPAVAMVMQALELEGKEVVDLTSQNDGPQITEIAEVKEPGTDDAINEISLGELDNMESLDNTVEESIKSSSLGSSSSNLDDNDAATADTNTSMPAGTDFSKMNVATLKGLAKKAKISGYSSLKKAGLISALEKHANQ